MEDDLALCRLSSLTIKGEVISLTSPFSISFLMILNVTQYHYVTYES